MIMKYIKHCWYDVLKTSLYWNLYNHRLKNAFDSIFLIYLQNESHGYFENKSVLIHISRYSKELSSISYKYNWLMKFKYFILNNEHSEHLY